MVFIRPDELHATASTERVQFERVLINFTDEFTASTADSAFTTLLADEDCRLLRFTLREQDEVEHLLSQMQQECMDQAPHHKKTSTSVPDSGN